MLTFQEEIEMSTFSSAVNSIIKNTCIIDFGIILKVIGKGVVKVGVSVARKPSDIQIITCTLLSTVSQTLSIDIEPQEGDKVLVLYPREYKEDMFDIDNKEVIIDSNSFGYSPVGAVAILFNQFRESNYEKNIKVNKDGELSLSVNDIVINTDKDNAISVDNGKATVTIDKDGYMSYTNTDDEKTKAEFTSSGMTLQDKNGMKIVSTSTSIKINDHLEIK